MFGTHPHSDPYALMLAATLLLFAIGVLCAVSLVVWIVDNSKGKRK